MILKIIMSYYIINNISMTLTVSRIMEWQYGLFRYHVRWGRSRLQCRRFIVFLFPRDAFLTIVRYLIAFFITRTLLFLFTGHFRFVRAITTWLPQVNSVDCISFSKKKYITFNYILFFVLKKCLKIIEK